MNKTEINNNIIHGIATILWGHAWANHVEDSREDRRKPCQNLSGCKIEDVMPKVPKTARQAAMLLARDFVKNNNGVSLADLLFVAYKADSCVDMAIEELMEELDVDIDYQVLFGESLAGMSMGTGVSWFDNHEKFPLNVPNFESYNLQSWAAEHCPECK